jgi:hypothetical protein
VTIMTGTRTWTLLLPAPAPLWSTNDSHKKGPRATSANRKEWRHAAYQLAQANRLPKGLHRIRLAFVFHFQDRIDRDALNYSETAKPVIDGFGPPFVQAPTRKDPKGKSAPGWSLIPNDTPKHLESTSLAIGPLWRDVLTGLDPKRARALESRFGGLTVTITDLSGGIS